MPVTVAPADPRYFTGQLLLAMPAIGDPRFERAILAVISHDAEGAMAIGIGQSADVAVADILEQTGLAHGVPADRMALLGGPVELQRGFVLHSGDWGGQGTVDVAGRFSVSGSLDILRAIAGGRGPRRWQLSMGHAGWAPGQLEAEIAADAWHVTHSDDHILFDLAPEARWQATMARDGIDPARIALRGGHA